MILIYLYLLELILDTTCIEKRCFSIHVYCFLTIKTMFLLLKGSTHDSTILKEQLIDIHNKHPQIFNQTNILIADGVAEHYEN